MRFIHHALHGWLATISQKTSPSLNAVFSIELAAGLHLIEHGNTTKTQPSIHSSAQQATFLSSSHFIQVSLMLKCKINVRSPHGYKICNSKKITNDD